MYSNNSSVLRLSFVPLSMSFKSFLPSPCIFVPPFSIFFNYCSSLFVNHSQMISELLEFFLICFIWYVLLLFWRHGVYKPSVLLCTINKMLIQLRLILYPKRLVLRKVLAYFVSLTYYIICFGICQ